MFSNYTGYFEVPYSESQTSQILQDTWQYILYELIQ